ncbi:MAG: hypothetical protein ACRDLL_02340 [Solirubrobacterales bacterium]
MCCETTARVGANLGFEMTFAIDAASSADPLPCRAALRSFASCGHVAAFLIGENCERSRSPWFSLPGDAPGTPGAGIGPRFTRANSRLTRSAAVRSPPASAQRLCPAR